MSLADLSKQQKQYIILGITGAVFVAILAVMGIQMSLSSIAKAKEELADLSEKIDKADRVLSKRNRTGEDFERTVSTLKAHLRNIPPEKNYYSWATEIIYSNGRTSDLEIESVDEMNADKRRHAEDSGEIVQFESYALRIAARGSYEQIKVFLRNIEEEYPLIRFTGIDISIGNDYDTHKVQLFIQWPFNLGKITKVWDDVESKQLKIAKRDALKSKAEPIKAAQKKDGQEAEPSVKAGIPKPEIASAPKPEPEPVVAPAPKPAPVVEPVREVAKPAPVVASFLPEAEPEPIVSPAPKAVAKAEPVSADGSLDSLLESLVDDEKNESKPDPAPVVESVPNIAEPIPTVAAVDPAPIIAPVPITEPKSEPAPEEVKSARVRPTFFPPLEPEPIVAPAPKPAPVVEPVPEVKKPAPVVATVVPEPPEPEPVVTPAPKPAPVANTAADAGSLDSILATLADLEKEESQPNPVSDGAVPVVSSTEANKPVDEFGSLLASLGSRGDEVVEPDPASEVVASSDPEALEAFVKQLEEQSIQTQQQTTQVEEQPAPAPALEKPVQYVSNGKSAALLVELLTKETPKEGGTLGSFLNGLVGEIND